MPRKPSVIEAHRAIVGVQPDVVVAKLAGVTGSAVRQYRIKRGIPARWRGEGGPAAPVAPGVAAVVDDPPMPRGLERSIFDDPKKPLLGPIRPSTAPTAALWHVIMVDGTKHRVVARDVIGAAKAAQRLGPAKEIERKHEVVLAPDICPV
jgi:hypothetical protein